MQLICDQLGDVEQTAEYNATPEERPDRPPRVRTSINPQAVRRALEAILASGEVPPPSLREVAEPIGQTYANLRHHLSERSRFISARTGATRKPRATNASTPAQEVRQAAVHLHRQGHYPSNTRIADLISNPSALRSRADQSARHEVLHELGWGS
jgi:hypothetical protein